MKRTLALLGAVALGTAWVAILATPAGATETADCKTVKTNFVNRPDNGHGSGGSGALPGYWADVSGIRTVEICVQPQIEPKKAEVVVTGALFTAKVSDHGTFVSKGGNTLSPNNGTKLLAGVKGTWDGGFTAKFVAPKPSAPGVWPYFDVSNLNNKTLTGMAARTPSHDQWIRSMWSNDADVKGDFIKDYSWLYKSCNEQWLETDKNHDGMDNSAGDITGSPMFKRVLVGCAGKPTFVDKCDESTEITLLNTAPNPDAVVLYHVNTLDQPNVVVKAKDSPKKVTVKPESHVTEVTYFDGKKITVEHTWVKPKSCEVGTTPTPTTGATPPVDNGTPTLPVTGSKIGYVAGGGVALLGLGVIAFVVTRRRRVRFEA